MEVFLKKEEKIGILELGRLTGMHPSTVNRICSDLLKRGYLDQSGKGGKYYLGRKYFEFTAAIKSRTPIRELAMPFLIKLNREIDETVTMAFLDGTHCVQMAVVPSNHLLKIEPQEGTTLSLYNSGLGKAILACLTDKQVDDYGRNFNFEQCTPNTITNLSDLKKHLLVIRQEGVAYDNEEHVLGIRNVSAAIKEHAGNVVGAIGAVGPSTRLTPAKIKEIAPLIKKCADEISKNLVDVS